MNIDFAPEQLIAIYRNTSIDGRKAVKDALGDQFTSVLPVKERVKDLNDAIAELGEEHPYVKAYRAAKYSYSKELAAPDIMAYLALRIITAALNEGWEPQFTEGERRWYCWYDLISKEDYESMSDEEKAERRVVGRAYGNAYANGGLVFSNAYYVSTNSDTNFGSRLALKSEELAEYAAKLFIEIYADFCFIPESKEQE